MYIRLRRVQISKIGGFYSQIVGSNPEVGIQEINMTAPKRDQKEGF